MSRTPPFACVAPALALALCAPVQRSLFAQGPVFLTSPNPTPVKATLSALSYVRKGSENDLQLTGNFGVHPALSFGLAALAVDSGAGTYRFARLQTQAKLRLWLREQSGERKIISLNGGLGVPLGETVDGVARAAGVTRVSAGVTAAWLGQRTSYYVAGLYTLDARTVQDRSTGTAGVALAWRPKPAPHGQTGAPGLTLFGEMIGHYDADHSGWLALAPAFVFRAGEAQVRGGVRLPVRKWNSTSSPMWTLGTSMFFRPSKR